jgi:hypothetical protein
MNISNFVRPNLRIPKAPPRAADARIIVAWRTFTRKLLSESVVGNPLHEAWTADGKPLERVSPAEQAKSCASRHVVVPHSRGR